MIQPTKSYIGTYYAQAEPNSVSPLCGFVVPKDESHALYRFRANGADPSAYVSLIWDNYGDDRKVIASTKGDVDLLFDTSVHSEHFVGDGVKCLMIVITNDNDSQSPIIGGAFEMVKVD